MTRINHRWEKTDTCVALELPLLLNTPAPDGMSEQGQGPDRAAAQLPAAR